MRDNNYVGWMAALGRGDQHPGGAAASELLSTWIDPWLPGSLVELGAGIGANAARLRTRGWTVTAVEPNPRLRRQGASRGLRVLDCSAESLAGIVRPGSVDVVVAESVLALTDLPRALASVATVLRPGGALAFCDLVWTEHADPARVREVHDDSLARFGIPVATRERLTWADWNHVLSLAGFDVRSDAPAPTDGVRAPGLSHRLRSPLASLRIHRSHRGQLNVPGDWLEARCALAVRL